MKVYYWCPFISHVATVTAVINSIMSLKKFSTHNTDYRVVNVFKEWSPYEVELRRNQIGCIDLGTFLNINFLVAHNPQLYLLHHQKSKPPFAL